MGRARSGTSGRVLGALAAVLVVRVVASVLMGYRRYAPPDFRSDFLRGREAYFWGGYAWAFYVHIASGPLVLLIGLFLVGDRARRWSPAWHRRLGWAQVAIVLGLVTPSGLAMARYAASGPVAAAALASLAVATAACTAIGARAAATRRFAAHRRWMWRSYLLLASAVVLRLIGGLGIVLGVTAPRYDPLATWLCWLLPLAAFEALERSKRRPAPSAIAP